MSRYRKIEVRTWSDEKFRALSAIPPSGQGLWFFLLTGPHTGPIPGLFRAGRAGMAEELGWSLEAFDEAFAEVSAQGMAKADFKARLVWLPKALRHNKPESPNVVRSWRSELDLLPECELKREALESILGWLREASPPCAEAFKEAVLKDPAPASAKPSPKPSAKHLPKAMANQEQEQEQEQEQNKEPYGSVGRADPATEPQSAVQPESTHAPSPAADALDRCPHDSIVGLYHDVLPELPRCRLMSDKRRRAITSFWRWVLTSKKSDGSRRAHDADQALTWVRAYFERARGNDFVMGRSGRSLGHENWTCDLEYLLSEKGRVQVIEKTKEAA